MAKRRSHDEEETTAWLGAAMIDRADFQRCQAELGEGGPKERAQADALALGRAALEAAGELGYQQVRVEELIDRAGSNRVRFYASFADKEACFAWAYAAAVDALCERLLACCTESADWAAAIRGGLVALGAFVAAEPAVAKGLLAESGGAGAAVTVTREETIERLIGAVDRGRRERAEPRHPLPSSTARFVLAAIQTAALRVLDDLDERSFEQELPGLLYMTVDYYLGPEAARMQVRELRANG